MIESITDAIIRANLASDMTGQKAQSGIKGSVNVGVVGTLNADSNDGGVRGFGWKAQNKSLAIFSGAAYNVEMGVTNEVFPNEHLAVHHMGSGLADGITQGNAGPDEFRSAPLWGLGQRIFFLHDGRTTDLMQAILAHQSTGSEANMVIRNFQTLSPGQQQDLLNFLRSL